MLREKEQKLERVLAEYGRVAVAFSGGADSSLLLRKALTVLGSENVLALTARSCLLKQSEIDYASTWLARHGYGEQARHEFVELQPLSWEEFVRNPPDRCYVCKLRVYGMFLEAGARQGITRLIDGTNVDDLRSDRPGLRAIRELDIGTPLAAAGLAKDEVRRMSREIGLDTWDHPSASCLATRIPHGLEITETRIVLIEKLESHLESLGFPGCRVRLDSRYCEKIFIQVREKDIPRLATPPARPALVDFFNDSGVKKIYLDLLGR
ncbi:MAG: ATP-dependent sacrificial sulfur transferase LarE [Desulfobulbaceae bacterium]|nr:ATP-dependent sacrificial sulfur transferase LarE [Desulfobulbaceae bacterium]